MKKELLLFVLSIVFFACEDNLPIEITTNTTATEDISVIAPQTNGTPHSSNETMSIDVNDLVSNNDAVVDINIDRLSYKYKNVVGNTAANIQSASIIINGVTIANQSKYCCSSRSNK